MRLNVRRILNTPGESLDFSFSVDCSDICFQGSYPAAEPLQVVGTVTNRAGALTLSMELSTTLHVRCDRCGKAFTKAFTEPFTSLLATELENEENDDIILLEEDSLDVEDLARTLLILGMDTKTLCSEDCQGLCARCGADLNYGACRCPKEVDPRLAVLATLLEKK